MTQRGLFLALLVFGGAVTLGAIVRRGDHVDAQGFRERVTTTAGQSSIVSSTRRGAASLLHLIDQFDDDDAGSDDGRDLLPLANLSFEQAAQAATAVVPGLAGEIDLEYDGDRLVFDVDVDGRSVKVDAITGVVLAAEQRSDD